MHNKKNAIYPGTFDPLTIGHISIIKRAALMFDLLIIGVAEHSNKNNLFSLDERVEITQEEVKKTGIENAIVKPFSGLLVNFASEQKARVIVRGLRAVSDFEYEFKMAYINNKLNNEIETIFLPGTEQSHFISSSLVKDIAKLKGNLSEFVSENVAKRLYQVLYSSSS